MTVTAYTVSDAGGAIDGATNGTIVGVSGEPFAFYVPNPEFDRDKAEGVLNRPYLTVLMVMPLGGMESGLFRYPRVGEKVLVLTEGSARYLMGYLPTSTAGSQDFQTAGMSENDGKGEVFRYQNNGVNFSGNAYSEIAFQSKYGSVEGATIPIDSINIQSTGNILNSAGNGYSLKADSLNMGIGGGDRSNAVISADAAGNVTIEAATSITLKVGRTTLSISDTSFSVKSQIADTPISNTWDADISLSPRGGFSASGMNCKLNADKQAVMSDSMGGIFSTTMGVGSLKGRELKMATYNAKEYKVLNITADIELVENMIALINGMEYQDRRRDLQKSAVDQAAKVAVAKQAAADADKREQKAENDLNAAKKAWEALEKAGSPSTGALREAFNQAVRDAKKAENSRHEAVEVAKRKRDEANARQNPIDAAADWGNIANLVIEWAGFIKTVYNTLTSLSIDWKNASTAREKAREMERKARLANLDLHDLTQEALEAKAKEKAIADYKAANPTAPDEDAEKHWNDLSKEEKGKKIGEERETDREENDNAYQDKLKDAAQNKANEEIAKGRYEATQPPPTVAWANLSEADQSQKRDDVKNALDQDTQAEREALTDKKIKELEVEKEKEWKKDEIYHTGGAEPLPPQP